MCTKWKIELLLEGPRRPPEITLGLSQTDKTVVEQVEQWNMEERMKKERS